MLLARVLRRSAAGLFWLTSAYLVLMLLVALSDEGQPTGMVSITNWNQLFYPVWYANPGLTTAVQLAVFAYPIAAVVFGFGSLILYSLDEPAETPKAGSARHGRAVERNPHQPFAEAQEKADSPPPPRVGAGIPIDLTPSYAQSFGCPDNLCVIDSAFVLRSIGRDAAVLLGAASPAMLVRRPLSTFVAAADMPALHAAAASLQHDPLRALTVPLRLRSHDASTVDVDAVCCAGVGPDGQVISLELKPRADRRTADDQMAAIWC